MKKIFTTVFISLITTVGFAQSAFDALMFSENNYEGTARSMAMGNAFTALGGDLGGVTINPAGSAVSNYSQITITPALTFSTNTAKGLSPYTDGSLPYFQNEAKSKITDLNLSNIGVTYNWETGRQRGLKNFTFGFIANQTNCWNGDVYANGTNMTTSFMGALATNASMNGYLDSDLGAEDAYDFMPWKAVTGFQSGMISTFGGMNDQYAGASEVIFQDPETGDYEITLGGPLNQTYGRRTEGDKHEYLLNFGGNVSDFVYFGVNLGLTSITYAHDEYFMEKAVNPNDFEIALDGGQSMYFQQMKYNYSYKADGSGVFGKFGVIVTPGYGLRLGAAVQTPTVTTINETWTEDGETNFSTQNYGAYSPYGTAEYIFTSPMRANFGVAYTYGSLGVISIDYELSDYSQMRYDTNNSDRAYFEEVNQDIRQRFGVSHMLRAGLEVKPTAEFAIRAGYGLTTSAEIRDSWSNPIDPLKTHNASFGIGYSSKGSFFMDAAIQTRFLHDEYYMPYEDYIFDEAGNVAEFAPEIRVQRSFLKALITFGWRF